MIIAKVKSNWNGGLSLDISHNEVVDLSELDDVLDMIQDVYSHIFSRDNKEIRFLIENNWIESRVDGTDVFIYYHSQFNMFERICTSYELRFLDDDTVYLHCYHRDRLVVCVRLV